MKNLYPLSNIILFSLLLFSQCAPKLDVTLYHHADDKVDAKNYHSYEFYGWSQDSDSILTHLQKRNIEAAFEKEFAQRDLVNVKENGDLIVSLYVVSQEVIETKATTIYNGSAYGYTGYGGLGYSGYSYGGYGYGNYYGYGPGYGWGSYMSTSTIYADYAHSEGTLIINIFDSKQKLLIYEAVVIKNVDGSVINDERLRDLVARSMMYHFQVPLAEKKKKK